MEAISAETGRRDVAAGKNPLLNLTVLFDVQTGPYAPAAAVVIWDEVRDDNGRHEICGPAVGER